MAVNDKKIAKLLERAESLDKRIREDTAERKQILAEIDRLSYANLKTELAKNDMTTDDYVQFIKMKKKMNDMNLTAQDIEKMLDGIIENTEGTDDEKKNVKRCAFSCRVCNCKRGNYRFCGRSYDR